MHWRLITVGLLGVLGAALLFGGCQEGEGGSQQSFAQNEGAVTLSDAEAAAVLDFVNDAETSFEVLDIDVGLNRRAAQNIVVHRNGPDEEYPTEDDNAFDSIGELDAVPYVGPAALEQIRDYAMEQGAGGGSGGEVGETVEGVVYSVEQAEAVIWGVNQATLEELDDTVGLNAKAAQNLVDNAPYQSVAEMGAVSYVGPAALTQLRDYASVWRAEMEANPEGMAGTYDGVPFGDDEAATALEIANLASEQQLADGGVTTSPRNKILDNRPWDHLETLAAFPGIGPATMQALKDMVPGWSGAVAPPLEATIELLVEQTELPSSEYHDARVHVSRAIITAEPQLYGSGNMAFFVADPATGNQQRLKVYIATSAEQDLDYLSLFDDVELTGKLTQYYSTWEILLDDAELHAVALNRGGVRYEQYLDLQDAWSSTGANPEGVVRLVSSFGYTYMVPLPLFKDHPMYDGEPDPGDPDSAYPGSDHPGQLWCGDQQALLDAWLASR